VRARRINHVSVRAIDLEESIRFYVDLLGLEPVPTPNFGHPVQWLRLGEQQFHLFLDDEGPAPRFHHLAVDVDDFEAVVKRARELGLFDGDTFGDSLRELPGGEVQMYIRDPAGNLVEIDWPDASTLDSSVVGELPKLADSVPQSPENQQARLFTGPGT
jgi:YD repeat-containing protein